MDPRQVVPQSNMPAYPWLAHNTISAEDVQARMRTLRKLGDPYTDADIAGAQAAVSGHTEMEALIAYLQGLGIANMPQAGAITATKEAAP
jgi:cytochrome c oxidase cbb3-type subunit 2